MRARRNSTGTIDRAASQVGCFDATVQDSAFVGSGPMTMMKCRGVDREGRVGVEDDEVGVAARGDRSLASREPDQLGGAQGHPAGQVGEREPAPARLGPDGRQGELERGDAAPRSEDVARVQVLELGRRGRVVRADRVDQAFAAGPPRAVRDSRAP